MRLELKNVSYEVAGKRILHDVSFCVEEGETLAILGRNGAGKSTLFEVITGVATPKEGAVEFEANRTFANVKKRVGVLWDDLSIFPLLRVGEVINYIAAIYGMKQCPPHLVDLVGLRSVLNTFASKLSRGENRKLGILLCVMHSPSLLILDEPTSALDPVAREIVWTDVFKAMGRSILLATQQWEEAMTYADKVAFIADGRLLCGPKEPQKVVADSNLAYRVVVDKDLRLTGQDVVSFASEAHRTLLLKRGQEHLLEEIALSTNRYSVFTPGLEDVYLLLTQGKP